MDRTSGRSRSLLLPIAIVVVVVVVLGGLYARKVLTQDRVEVIGDSITVITEPVLHDDLDGRHKVDVQAVGGMEVAQMQPQATQAALAAPDQVVINLGTNDVIHGKPIDKAAQDLEAMT